MVDGPSRSKTSWRRKHSPAFHFSARAIWWGDEATARAYAKALADRDGPIVPLVTGRPDTGHVMHERHLCVDTTAAGGNASLLAGGASS